MGVWSNSPDKAEDQILSLLSTTQIVMVLWYEQRY